MGKKKTFLFTPQISSCKYSDFFCCVSICNFPAYPTRTPYNPISYHPNPYIINMYHIFIRSILHLDILYSIQPELSHLFRKSAASVPGMCSSEIRSKERSPESWPRRKSPAESKTHNIHRCFFPLFHSDSYICISYIHMYLSCVYIYIYVYTYIRIYIYNAKLGLIIPRGINQPPLPPQKM